MIIEDAKTILSALEMPKKQQSDICAYALVALAGVSNNESWESATNKFLRIHDIIKSTKEIFHAEYAENSRETFRKQAMHPFRIAALIEDNGKATNSPNYMYRLTPEALNLIRKFGTEKWDMTLESFLIYHDALSSIYASKKKINRIEVTIEDTEYTLSVGEHNDLQKAIIDEFKPRFAPNSRGLYLGDTENNYLFQDSALLAKVGVEINLHDKLPDIILYDSEKDWIFFIEAVTSVGPMSPKRIIEINEISNSSKSAKIFVTAFPDAKTFKKFYEELAWETEVWIAESPEHLLHLDGNRFMGPE